MVNPACALNNCDSNAKSNCFLTLGTFMKLLVFILLLHSFVATAQIVEVYPDGEAGKGKPNLSLAIEGITPGITIKLLPGIYKADSLMLKNIQAEKKPITVIGSTDEKGRLLSTVAGTREPGNQDSSCFFVTSASGIVFTRLNIKSCWPTFLSTKDSQNITLRDSVIEGSTAVVFAKGEKSSNFLITGNKWTQDPSKKIWNYHDWSELHHGNLAYFNGALFLSKDIVGDVTFSHNHVSYAYNAIRMKAKSKQLGVRNVNIDIHNNTFEYIRDNIVEPEGTGLNWWVHHNKIKNVHAWFSITEAAISHFYFFANTGFNGSNPCDTGVVKYHCGGKIFKFELTGPFPAGPIKIFNNSWYATSSIFRGGPSRFLQHWNNAIEFARAKDRFFNEAPIDPSYNFDFDIANNGFDAEFKIAGFEMNGIKKDPGFTNAKSGKFALKPNSPAFDSGLYRPVAKQNWQYAGKGPDIGAYDGKSLHKGPKFTRIEPHKPVILTEPQMVEGQYDGLGKIHIWKGEGDCSQKEGMPPAFILQDGAKLSNLTLINAPDGVHVRGKNVKITNLHVPDVCEDAITLKSTADNIEIIDSVFENCSDKGIQITSAKNALIKNNQFLNCKQPIRAKQGSKNIRIEGNFFASVHSAARITGPASVSFTGNEVYVAKNGIWTEGDVQVDIQNNIYKRVYRPEQTSYPRHEFNDEKAVVILDIVDSGLPGASWQRCIQDRHSESEFKKIISNKRPATKPELDWHKRFLEVIPEWESQRPSVDANFPKGVVPPTKIRFVLGNQGGNDGFTKRTDTICADLSHWVKSYTKEEWSVNKPRMKRVLSHEYAHLLTKKWLEKHPQPQSSFKEKVLFKLFYEGIGHYFSLSSKWVQPDGQLTTKANQQLEKLVPIFHKRMKRVLAGDSDPEIFDNMVSGSFGKKWGALTVALWLSKKTGREPVKVADWIAGGSNNILQLAKQMNAL